MTSCRRRRPAMLLLAALVALLSVEPVAGQNIANLFAFVRVLCPLLRLFGVELGFCDLFDDDPSPSPPVKSPVKAPVKGGAPTPVASSPNKAPSPVVTAPTPTGTAPAPVPAGTAPTPTVPVTAPTLGLPTFPPERDDTPRAPIPPIAAPVPTPIVPTPLASPIIISLPTPLFTLLNFPTKFNAVGSGPICITVTNRLFSTNTADVTLSVNSAAATISSLSSSQVCTTTRTLVNGINAINLVAKDSAGFGMTYDTSVWAGANSMTVNLVDANNNRFTRETVITATLSDDSTVKASRTTSTGAATFTNLPSRTIIFTAVTTASSSSSTVNSGSVAGSAGTSQTSVTLPMAGFLAPSTVVNNDLALGTTAGWTIAVTSTVQIVPHVVNPGPKKSGTSKRQLQLVNNDIELTTRRQRGETKLSRCFRTTPGSTGILVRYRFVTEEIPDWFGSKYNDYFRVSIRTAQAGGSTSQANTMNGLGLAEFDIPTKSTSWRRALLPLDPNGDTVQVDITVANVEDGLFQSKVIVDFIEEVGRSVCIYTNVADGVGTPALSSGHTALLAVENAELGAAPKITSYSLYPDNYGNGIVNNGVDSDVRINVPLDDYKSGYPYMYCEMVTDRELADFILEVTKPSTFVCTENNAAAFAARLFQQTTGKTVNAVDLSGLSSSRKVGQSIRALNGGSNMPPGGLPWSARRQRRHSRDFRDFRRVLQDRQPKPKRVLQSTATVNSSQSCGF